MKVLIIHDLYSLGGGTERTVLLLIKYLEKIGHEVVFIHGDEPDAESKLYHSGRAYRIPELFEYRITSKYRKLGFRELKEIIEAESPDVIHLVHFYNPWIVKELIKLRPTVRAVHLPWIYCPGGQRFSLNKYRVCSYRFGVGCIIRNISNKCAFMANREPFSFLGVVMRVLECYQERQINSRLSKIIANSEYTKSELVKAGYRANQVLVVYPPVELYDNYINNEEAGEFILFVGRLIFIKGVDHLIRAIKLLKTRILLVIVGDGPERDNLEKLSFSSGINDKVRFVGKVNTDELINYYKLCNLIVIPSLCPESFGLSGIEAIAYGKPVVAYNTGGIKEWLVDGITGYLINPGDINGLTDKISLILSNPELSNKMGIAGMERAKLFSVEAHTKKMLEIYEKAVKNFHGKFSLQPLGGML